MNEETASMEKENYEPEKDETEKKKSSKEKKKKQKENAEIQDEDVNESLSKSLSRLVLSFWFFDLQIIPKVWEDLQT